MRHRIQQKKLNRTSEHRKALLRNLALSLVEHGTITTTLPKAKTLRPYVERLINLAIRSRKRAADGDVAGSLRARRCIHRLVGDRSIVPADHRLEYEAMTDSARRKTLRMPSGRRHRTGEPKGRLAFTGESATRRLIETVAPRYEDRPGGYTRIIKLADRRIGDGTRLAMIQLVGDEDPPISLTKPAKSARHRRTDSRYALAVQLAKGWSGKGNKSGGKKTEAPADDAASSSDSDAS